MNRFFEFVLALVLMVPLVPIIALVSVLVLVIDGRPVFFRSARMQDPSTRFILFKFRTMTVAPDTGVTGGDKHHRITRLGRVLRRFRLDELPQIVNVLVGDIGFVGPRPPAPEAVEAAPETYSRVLMARPGITGLATLCYHKHEERILRPIVCSEQVQATYLRRCVPRKAKLDLLYARNKSFGMDIWLIGITAAHLVGISPKGRLWRRRSVNRSRLHRTEIKVRTRGQPVLKI